MQSKYSERNLQNPAGRPDFANFFPLGPSFIHGLGIFGLVAFLVAESWLLNPSFLVAESWAFLVAESWAFLVAEPWLLNLGFGC